MPNKRLIFAWALALPVSYFTLGFLDAYYLTEWERGAVALVLQTLVQLYLYLGLGRATHSIKKKPSHVFLMFTLAAGILTFFIGLVLLANRFPTVFKFSAYVLAPETLISFMAGSAAAGWVAAWLVQTARRQKFHLTIFYKWVNANFSGLTLAALFLGVYFIPASIFNQPIFNYDDIFFDTDSNLYRQRFGSDLYKDYYERTVHPYVLILVRPFTGIISLFLKGDRLHGAIILTALTGAACVFLVWYFVRHATHNKFYAALMASLFGVSAAHLAFSSLIENYIFLAFTGLLFMVLLLKNSPLWALALTGLAAFGVTISNIAQTVIAHLMVKRNIPQLIKYGLIVGALILPLNLLNNFIYPNAHPYLWEVNTLQYEDKNVFEPSLQRANYLGRVMLLHSFVAPDPLLLKEDIPFLKVWIFRAALKNAPLQIAQYETLFGNILVFIWLGLLGLGGILFLKNLFKQDQRFSFAFILIVLFSFVLHMRYGRDVFLYSANWTYALTLFLALAWREIANTRWFQSGLLAFIFLLMVNNARLIHIMLLAAYTHLR